MILSVTHLYKSFGKEQVLKDISFEIEKPQIIALIGPNGSGKSTLLSIITNLLSADRGKITVLNKKNTDSEIFREISFLQDNSVLYEYLTGYDHLQFIGDMQSISKESILDTAERIGITSYLHKKVRTYSLGMKQHLLLAMAILNQPKLLILDEPLNGLDPTSAIKVRNLLVELNEGGTTILLSSHNLSEIDRITSQILFLKNGSLIKEDLSAYERVFYQITVDDSLNAQIALEKAGVAVNNVEKNILSLHLNSFSIAEILEVLHAEKVLIRDIEKKILGSEERYQTLFGKQDSTL